MHSIARYIFCVLLLAVAMQVVCIALIIYGARQEIVDTRRSRQTIFQTEAKMAVYGSPLVVRGSDKPQIVILGTSNTVAGVRPEKLQPLLGVTRIHSLAVGAQRFRAFDQIITLLYRQTPPENRRNYVFVLGLSYPLIADMPVYWQNKKTRLDEELLRFGVFTETAEGVVPRVAEAHISSALQAAWPFLVPKAVYNFVIRLLPESLWFGLAEPLPLSDKESNTIRYTPEQNKARIDYYNAEVIDTDGKQTFELLMQTVERVTAAGGQVVLVDLPSATWLQQAAPIHAAYEQLKKPYLARLEKFKNVHYVDAQNGFSDDDFYDGIHPRARITEKIASLIAPTIKQAQIELENDRKK